jgi:hypothetical protein
MLTPAHHDLIRMLAEQSAREWLLGQRQPADEPQQEKSADEGLPPSTAPDMPDL